MIVGSAAGEHLARQRYVLLRCALMALISAYQQHHRAARMPLTRRASRILAPRVAGSLSSRFAARAALNMLPRLLRRGARLSSLTLRTSFAAASTASRRRRLLPRVTGVTLIDGCRGAACTCALRA